MLLGLLFCSYCRRRRRRHVNIYNNNNNNNAGDGHDDGSFDDTRVPVPSTLCVRNTDNDVDDETTTNSKAASSVKFFTMSGGSQG